jgi:hypothetical protein
MVTIDANAQQQDEQISHMAHRELESQVIDGI